jgi:hypothetical protein
MFVTVMTFLSEEHNISISVPLKMEAVCSSETPVYTHNTKPSHYPRTHMTAHRNLPWDTRDASRKVIHYTITIWIGRLYTPWGTLHTHTHTHTTLCKWTVLPSWVLSSTAHTANHKCQQRRQRTYNAMLRNVRVTIVAVKKQWVLHILIPCL